MRSKPSVDATASIAREDEGVGLVRYVSPRPGGANMEALPFAEECIRELQVFMLIQGAAGVSNMDSNQRVRLLSATLMFELKLVVIA